jgi:hypothetical protein
MNYVDFDELHDMIQLQPIIQQWREMETGLNTSSSVLLAACLEHLAHGIQYGGLQRSYGVSSTRIHDAMGVYLTAICQAIQKDPRYAIKFPEGDDLKTESARWSRSLPQGPNFSFLTGACGATDGTLIPIRPRFSTDVLEVGQNYDGSPTTVRAFSVRPFRCRKGVSLCGCGYTCWRDEI